MKDVMTEEMRVAVTKIVEGARTYVNNPNAEPKRKQTLSLLLKERQRHLDSHNPKLATASVIEIARNQIAANEAEIAQIRQPKRV